MTPPEIRDLTVVTELVAASQHMVLKLYRGDALLAHRTVSQYELIEDPLADFLYARRHLDRHNELVGRRLMGEHVDSGEVAKSFLAAVHHIFPDVQLAAEVA